MPPAAYSPDQWHEFAAALASASGAIAGLVFVAVSVNARTVLADRFHGRRAGSTFLILLAVLAFSIVLLFPGQGRVAVGAEAVIAGAALELRAAGTVAVLRARTSREGWASWAVAVTGNLLVLAGGVSLLAGTGGGLYLVASGLVIVLIRAVYDIWRLFTAASAPDPQPIVGRSAE
jgi:modulator of FtsH protease